jgi:hypothetical protein
MSSRYIDIDSGFRNRKSYPDVGSFVVTMNDKTTNSTPATAKDPVILSFPYDTGIYTNLSQVSLDGISYYGFSTSGANLLRVDIGNSSAEITNFYVGNYIQIQQYFFKIIYYSWTPSTPSPKYVICDQDYPGGPTSYPNTTGGFYTIRYQLPELLAVGTGAAPASIAGITYVRAPVSIYEDYLLVNAPSASQVVLGSFASSKDGAYVGKYLFLPPLIPILPFLTTSFYTAYQWSLITAYTGATKTATVKTPFISAPLAMTAYQILTFSYDNYKSLVYAGTSNLNNPRCSSVSLSNLIIPSYLPIANTNAGYITDYPYVWVAVYAERGGTYQHPIISASPASNRALFKCTIGFNQPTKFLSLGSVTNGQNVFFKQDDDLRVEILLPNGEPIRFTPSLYTLFSGSFTFFPGLDFPIPPDPQQQVQLVLNVTYNN